MCLLLDDKELNLSFHSFIWPQTLTVWLPFFEWSQFIGQHFQGFKNCYVNLSLLFSKFGSDWPRPPQSKPLNPTFSTHWIEIRLAPDIPLWSACRVMDTPLVKRKGNVNVCYIPKGWVKVSHDPLTLCKCCGSIRQLIAAWETRSSVVPQKHIFHFNPASATENVRVARSHLNPSASSPSEPWQMLRIEEERVQSFSICSFYPWSLSSEIPVPIWGHAEGPDVKDVEEEQKKKSWQLKVHLVVRTPTAKHSGCFYSCATIYMQHW